MSNFLYKKIYENQNEQENKNLDNSKRMLGVGALVGGAFLFNGGKESLQGQMGAIQRSINGGEFARAGKQLKADIDVVKAITDNRKTAMLESFRSSLRANADANFDTSSGRIVSDQKAFFAAMFDTVVNNNSIASPDTKDLIKRAYNDISGLSNDEIDSLRSLHEDLILKDRKNLEDMQRNLNKYTKIKTKLTKSETGNFQRNRNQIVGNVLDLGKVRSGSELNNYSSTDQSKIKARLKTIEDMLGGKSSLKIIGFEDGGLSGSKKVKSLYAQVSIGGKKKVNIPLFLGKDAADNIVYRATENLSTRYVAPLAVLNTATFYQGGTLDGATRSTIAASAESFEDFILRKLEGQFGGRKLDEISKRQVTNYYEYLRNYGIDMPRGIVDQYGGIRNSGTGNELIPEKFRKNLTYSRSTQSSRLLIEISDQEKKVAKDLLKRHGNELIAIGYPQIDRYDNPFNRGESESFTSLTLRQFKGKETLNAFSALENYGRKDRALIPQTAREFQFNGRYEMFSGVEGMASTNKMGLLKNINVSGTGKELLGINTGKSGEMISGVNVGAILVSEKRKKGSRLKGSQALGLGEGMAYFGGKAEVDDLIVKTVADTTVANTTLMEKLLEARADSNRMFLSIGSGANDDYTVDDFFRIFGDGNEVSVGNLDNSMSTIKKTKGLKEFTLGIAEKSHESGRDKYHIVGMRKNIVDRLKMFGILVKHTTTNIDRNGIEHYLKQIGYSPTEVQDVMDSYFNNLNMNINNTLFMDTNQVVRSPQALASQIGGSLELFGVSREELKKRLDSTVGDDIQYKNIIDSLEVGQKEGGAALNDLSYKSRQAGYVYEVIRQATDLLSNNTNITDNAEREKSIGRSLGAVGEAFEKYELTEREFKDAVRLGLGTSGLDLKNVLEEIEKGITFTAQYTSAGGIQAQYGRNLAKTEPRFMNYVYGSLRGNFGLSENEATSYISDIVTRQVGSEDSAQSLLGMKLNSYSLSSLKESSFEREISSLASVETLSDAEKTMLLGFGQGREKEVRDFLSDYKNGALLNLDSLNLDDKYISMIKKEIGEKGQIYLPGRDTMEGLVGHQIRSAQETIELESAYTRNLTDLISSISEMESATDDQSFFKGLQGFRTSKQYLADLTGTTIRQSLSKRVLGSGTYMGQGIVFGKTEAESTRLASNKSAARSRMRSAFLDLFNSEKGYAIFQDAQGFLDGSTTLKEAMRKSGTRQGLEGKDLDEYVDRNFLEGMERFFFGMYKKSGEKTGIKGLAQRNPTIYYGHYAPNITIGRYDFAEGYDDFAFNYLKKRRKSMKPDVQNKLQKYFEQYGERQNFIDLLSGKAKIQDPDIERIYGIYSDGEKSKRFREIISGRKKGFEKSIARISGKISEKEKELVGSSNDPTKARGLENELKGLKKEKEKLIKRSRSYKELMMGKNFVTLGDSIFGNENNLNDSIKSYKMSIVDSRKKEQEILSNLKILRRGSNLTERIRAFTSFYTGNDLANETRKISELYSQIDGLKSFNFNLTDYKIDLKAELEKQKNSNPFFSNSIAIPRSRRQQKEMAASLKHFDNPDIGEVALKGKGQMAISSGKRVGDRDIALRERVGYAREISAIRRTERLKKSELELNQLKTQIQNSSGSQKDALLKKQKKLEKNIKFQQDTLSRIGNKDYLDKSIIEEGVFNLDRKGFEKLVEETSGDNTEALVRKVYDLGTNLDESFRNRVKQYYFQGAQTVDDAMEVVKSQLKASLEADIKKSKTEQQRAQEKFDKENAKQKSKKGKKKTKALATARANLDSVNSKLAKQEAALANLNQRISKTSFENLNKGILNSPGAGQDVLLLESDYIFDDNAREAFKQSLEKKSKAGYTLEEIFLSELDETQEENIRARIQGSESGETLLSSARDNTSVAERNLSRAKAGQEVTEELLNDQMRNIYKSIYENQENLTEARDVDFIRPIKRIEEAIKEIEGRDFDVRNFEELNYATSRIREHYGAGGVLSKDIDIDEELSKIFNMVHSEHKKVGDIGGGTVYYPELNVEADLVNTEGKKVSSYSGRLDFSRFSIGDFDADIYQIFYNTDQSFKASEAFSKNMDAHFGLYQSGTSFLMHMSEIGKGMEAFGKRLGAGNLNLQEFVLDQYEKERILKSVGGLDVQIKMGMLGLTEGAAELVSSGNYQEGFRRIRAGASLIAVAQEVLIIKAKKLGIAADVGNEFLGAIRKSFDTGEGSHLFDFFDKNVFPGSIYENEGKVSLQNVSFTNVPDGEGTRALTGAIQGMEYSKEELRETFNMMARTVKKKGWGALASDSRMGRILKESRAFSMEQFSALMSASMEGSFSGSESDLENIFERLERDSRGGIGGGGFISQAGRSMGRGGALALAAAGASYLIGVTNTPGAQLGESKFSDISSRENVGNRMLANTMSREHGNISPSSLNEYPNLYERPIHTNSTMVSYNSSARMYGEAATLSDGIQAARQFTSTGGNGFLDIRDNKMPISNSYINKSLRD